MNLVRYVALKELRERFDLLLPKYATALPTEILAPPARPGPSLVGTAYDYAVRIELARRAEHAQAFPWIAEQVHEEYVRNIERMRARSRESPAWSLSESALKRRLARTRRMGRVIAGAREAAQPSRRRLGDRSPRAIRMEIGAHGVRLAKLDLRYRTGVLDETFERAEPSVTKEVADLLAITPLGELMDPETMILNPTLGPSPPQVRLSADADLVIGERLIDLKTSAKRSVKREDVRQLLGYFLLIEIARSHAPALFPKLSSLELYYARYATFVRFDADELRDDPRFAATLEWFVDGARNPRRMQR